MQSVYTAKCGLISQQHRLNAISNNIANVNTTGYKSSSVGFKDALYTQMLDPSEVDSGENLMQGSGLMLGANNRDYSVGATATTAQKLDFYLNGDGYFTVKDGNGNSLYTRNGTFSVSSESEGRFLVNANGYYLLDTQGERITLPEEETTISVTPEGELSLGEDKSTKLNIVTFTNKDGLLHKGDSCFAATDASGASKESDARVIQGCIETSNVDLGSEMTKLLRTQRAYSIAASVLSTWNEMASVTNNIV